MNGIAFARKPGRNLILRGQGVAPGPGKFSAGSPNGLDEHGGFFGHVEAPGDAHAGKRFCSLGLLLEFGQDRHSSTGPIDEQGTFVGQSNVANGVVLTLVQVIHERLNGRPLLNSIVRPRRILSPHKRVARLGTQESMFTRKYPKETITTTQVNMKSKPLESDGSPLNVMPSSMPSSRRRR